MQRNMALIFIKKMIYVAAVFIFLLSKTAVAYIAYYEKPRVADQVNNSFFLGFTLMNLNFREDNIGLDHKVPGNVKDVGLAYGITANVRNVFFEKLYTDFSGEYVTGKIKYDGYKMVSPYEPLSFKATNNFANIDAKLGVVLLNYEHFQIIPYGGFGFRYWSRTTSSDCRYYNFKPIAGVRLNISLGDDLVLSPYADLGMTLWGHAKSKAYDAAENFIGDVNHKLGNKAIREAGLEINYRLENEIFLTAAASYTGFMYGKSSPQHVGSYAKPFTEPNSKTNEYRFTLGVRYSFL